MCGHSFKIRFYDFCRYTLSTEIKECVLVSEVNDKFEKMSDQRKDEKNSNEARFSDALTVRKVIFY